MKGASVKGATLKN